MTEYKRNLWVKAISLIFIQSVILLIIVLSPLDTFGQDKIMEVGEDLSTANTESEQSEEITLQTVKDYAEVISIFLEIIIILLLAKTVKDFAELAKVSKLQTEVRFRPWVGPHGGIEFMRSFNEREQYCIKIKNFAEVPASNVTAYSIVSDSVPKKELFSDIGKLKSLNDNGEGNKIDKFRMGPLLPSMEKRYWVFIKEEMIKKTKEGTSNLFLLLYFSYDFPTGRSGYGMISQFDKNTDTFVHIDMWID